MSLLVVDTDCGSDDAMALMLALGGARADRLLAITCCFGNTTVANVRRNVGRVLRVCGSTEIPVYSGSNHPLLRPFPDPIAVESSVSVHGSDGFGNSSDTAELDIPTREQLIGIEKDHDESATEALLRLSRERPGEITLVALAPLTNVVIAHRADDGFTGRLKEIVCLGGNYTGVGNVTEWAEFNFFSDPESAHIVLNESKCPIRLVTWETCLKNGMEWDDFYSMLKTPGKKAELIKSATSIVSKFCEEEGDPAFLDCDVLGMAAALWPECVTETISMDKQMGVVCNQEKRRGMCVIGGEIKGVTRMGVDIGSETEEGGVCGIGKSLLDEENEKGVSFDLKGSIFCKEGGAELKYCGPKIEIVKAFDVSMLEELRKDMVA